MQISTLIPIVGVIVILANILACALFPYSTPTIMGVQLFIGGMTTLTIAIVALINPIQGISGFERMLLFVAGCINCSTGYYMVLLHLRRQT